MYKSYAKTLYISFSLCETANIVQIDNALFVSTKIILKFFKRFIILFYNFLYILSVKSVF